MNAGMLWLDAHKNRSLEEKVLRAAEYYEGKYGHLPDLCLVNSKVLAEERKVGKIQVQPAKTVLLHHFWLGAAAS